MIRVTCACGKALRAPPDAAGKAVKCPGCGARLRVPAPIARPPAPPPPQHPAAPFAFGGTPAAGPAPAGDPDPFSLDDIPDTSPTYVAIADVRRLARYWKKENGGRSALDPGPPKGAANLLTPSLRKFGTLEGVFPAGAAPGAVPWATLGPIVCGGILLMALATAGFCLGVEELRKEYSLVGIIAIPVVVLAVAGWVVCAKKASAARNRRAYLFDTGFAVAGGGETTAVRWDEIDRVGVKPENQSDGFAVHFGHKFTVTLVDGGTVVLGPEYFANVDLGLAVMERAAAAGARCSGRVTVPG